jgi:hypothetical protein
VEGAAAVHRNTFQATKAVKATPTTKPSAAHKPLPGAEPDGLIYTPDNSPNAYSKAKDGR